ncbi:MAG: FAD binding domain-containing protein [Pseudomonadota bacterium]
MYFAPTTVPDALAALQNPGVRVLAGGTDFYPALGDAPLPAIVDISRIKGLSRIEVSPQGISIGAAATWSDLVRAPLPPAFDGLKAAAREIGAIQIQNAGTLVGNLCNASPAADGVPALLTLDARVAIEGPTGPREVPVADFVKGVRTVALEPGALVVGLIVPPPPEGAKGAFIKLGARRHMVISIAMVAAAIALRDGRVSHARVAVGSCSAVATRLTALEDALMGTPVDQIAKLPVADHLAPLTPIDDVRGTAAYREAAALELTRRTLEEAARA